MPQPSFVMAIVLVACALSESTYAADTDLPVPTLDIHKGGQPDFEAVVLEDLAHLKAQLVEQQKQLAAQQEQIEQLRTALEAQPASYAEGCRKYRASASRRPGRWRQQSKRLASSADQARMNAPDANGNDLRRRGQWLAKRSALVSRSSR
jgi:hypothetical protein